jgi:hypothetical protein
MLKGLNQTCVSSKSAKQLPVTISLKLLSSSRKKGESTAAKKRKTAAKNRQFMTNSLLTMTIETCQPKETKHSRQPCRVYDSAWHCLFCKQTKHAKQPGYSLLTRVYASDSLGDRQSEQQRIIRRRLSPRQPASSIAAVYHPYYGIIRTTVSSIAAVYHPYHPSPPQPASGCLSQFKFGHQAKSP